MNIQLVSDLHLEFGEWPEINNVGADVLVLSGDICVAAEVKRVIRFFEDICSRWRNVVYVMGNHEHYKGNINTTLDVLKDALGHITNLHILEDDYVVLGDTYFYGATFWTDCNNNDTGTKYDLQHGMNDYRLITVDGRHKLLPSDTIEIHKHTLDSLSELIKVMDTDRMVVVGHHAPSKQSTHPRYKDDFFTNGGYSSDLEEFIKERPQIKLWTHGHTHDSFDYMVGSTRVVCNSAGYPRAGRESNGGEIVIYRENINFKTDYTIEV